ncbi:MAG: SWIM zinc finger family protein [Amaricoccus sp.]
MKRAGARFEPERLRDAAGERAFARGAAYFRDGAVRLLGHDRATVTAIVSGGEDYSVRLTGRGGRFGGSCTCHAFEDSGFCKHMVATALAANAAEAAGAADPMAAVRAHLAALPHDALVALVLEQAVADPALMRRLSVAAAVAGRDPAPAAAALRRELDAATREDRLPGYREVHAWTRHLEELLAAVGEFVAAAGPADAFALAEHALDRIGSAVVMVDDSGGDAGGLILRAAELHLAACTRLRPDPLALARDLFAREVGGSHDAFYGAAHTYADVLGPAGAAEYRRLAQAAWEAIPARGPAPRGRLAIDIVHGEYALFALLDGHAEDAGDLDARIALRAKNLSSPWDYVRLAAFCRESGRPEEALARAEEGLFVFEDHPPDQRLVDLAAELLIAAGRAPEAGAHLWRAFDRRPTAELYRRLAAGGGPARDRAIGALEAKLPATAGLMVELLTDEGAFDRAWAIARAHKAVGQLDRLARASEASHPREAIAVYTDRIERLAAMGGDGNYAEAAELLARMAPLRPASEQAGHVAAIRARHGRKRNFMKRLG